MGSHRCLTYWTLGATALLAACASAPDRYPSLAVRDAERFSGSFTPTQVPTEDPVAPVASAASLAELVASARSANQRFRDSAPSATRLIESTRVLSPETNDWAQAQIALADLTVHHGTAVAALSDLDLLAVEAATTFAPRSDIAAAQAQVRSWVAEQSQTLSTLTGISEP